jgi:hypothetical protein
MPTVRFIRVAACLILAVLWLTPSTTADVHSSIKVASTGDNSERVSRLPISRKKNSRERVVMSLPAGKVGGIRPGDGLRISAELQVTVDCDHNGPRCTGDPYHYSPRITTYAVLAPRPDSTGGAKIIPLASAQSRLCRQSLPNREHHCVLVRDEKQRRVGADAPCLKSRCYVNLVASAHSPRAHAGEYVTVGGLRPNGKIPQDRGRLNVVRTSPEGNPDHRTYRTSRIVSRNLGLDQQRAVVFAQRLDGLKGGAQLIVEAKAVADISHLPYNVVFSSQLIITDKRGDIVRDRGARFIGERGELDEGNGFNCTQNKGRCTIRKVGVVSVTKTPVTKGGRPMDLYVALVTVAGPKRTSAAPGDRVPIRGGTLRTIRYSPRVALR